MTATQNRLDAHQRAVIEEYIGRDKWTQAIARANSLRGDTLIVEGLMSEAQWSWGDLTVELVPLATPTTNGLVGVILDAFIKEAEVPWTRNTLHSLRQVAAAWPKKHRANAPFAVHKVLKSRPDRYELIRDGMTVAEARHLVGQKGSIPKKRATATDAALATRSWARVVLARLNEGDELDENTVNALREAAYILQDILAEHFNDTGYDSE